MAFIKKWILYLVIAALVIALIFTKACGGGGSADTVPDTVKTTRWLPGDPVPYKVEVKTPYPVFVDTGSTKYLPANIDTPVVIKDYYGRVGYNQVVRNDSELYIRMFDTLQCNRIVGRGMEIQNKRKTAIINNYITNAPEHNKVFVGSQFGADFNGRMVVAPMILFESKKNFAVDVAYDLLNGTYQVGLFYKISFRKPRDGLTR